MIGPGVHKHYEAFELTTGVPMLVTKDTDHIIISSGKIIVPADVVLTVNFSRNGKTFPGHPSDVVGATNTIIDLDGVESQQIRLTKTAGAGNYVEVIYAQGDRGGPQSVVISGTPAVTISGTPSMLTYNATPPTPTSGQSGALQGDQNLNLKTRDMYAARAENNPLQIINTLNIPLSAPDGSWTPFTNYGVNATLNMKASYGNVKSIYCHSRDAAVLYFQLHETTTVPAGGAVPKFTFLIPIGGTVEKEGFFGMNGVWSAIGWAFAVSTTEHTYTAATAANQTTECMIK